MLGEPNVGKSELNKFCSSRFEDSMEQIHEQIYGVSFAVKILKSVDIEMTLVVWNFTGQERYKTLQPHYMTGVSGILLLFDLTRLETFKKLPDWINFIHQNLADAPILLIGTKADLFHLKNVDDTDIEQFVIANKLQGYYEVSFKTGLNVTAVINKISELIYRRNIDQIRSSISPDFKLQRPHADQPVVLDEEKVVTNYTITMDSIYNTIFQDIFKKLNALESSLNESKTAKDLSKKEQLSKDLETISGELTVQNKKIQELLDESPFPLTIDLKGKLTEDWTNKRDQLLYRILLLKDVLRLL
ncbi:MAG: GTP-binding protein [Candidatus Helarchaeota archaeon]|nr:GTP-binding protein [Candidatus Helarchaeota archaeon]